MTLSQSLKTKLFDELKLDPQGRFFVGFSGGVDSTVLLHAMVQLRQQCGFSLTALHVSHNLQLESAEWARHCEHFCDNFEVEYKQTSLSLASAAEEGARDARYHWFSEQVDDGDVLLTAHHQQDRAETLLFNLMRGAGSTGLSSLRAIRPFYTATYSATDAAKLVRPFLDVSKAEIIDYAKENALQWVEDPSNQRDDYARNDIRHNVIPALVTFRRDAINNIARAAENLERENALLNEVAIADLANVRQQAQHLMDLSYALCINDLVQLSPARQANALRVWLHGLQLHTPSQRFMATLMLAISKREPPSSTAILQEGGYQFRFYRGYLFVMPAFHSTEQQSTEQQSGKQKSTEQQSEKQQETQDREQVFAPLVWPNAEQPLCLYGQHLRLTASSKLTALVSSNPEATLRLVTRNEVQNPKASAGHSLNLKKWLQQADVPPWRRQALPLLVLSDMGSDLMLTPIDQSLSNDWVALQITL